MKIDFTETITSE